MATRTIDRDKFHQLADSDGITIVDFWASWCGPCRSFAPTFEQASETHPDITFAKVDTEAHMELSRELQIRSIPTIMVLRDGHLVFEKAGALSQAGLEQLIVKTRELDMDQVRTRTHS